MSSPSIQSFKGAIDGFLGKELIAVSASLYEKNGYRDEAAPLYIFLTFVGVAYGWRIGCASDGESLLIDNQPLQAIPMQQDGRVLVYDVSSNKIWKKLIGSRLNNVVLVTTNKEIYVIGFKLEFDADSIYVLNLGDELVVVSELPNNFIDDENAKLISIKEE